MTKPWHVHIALLSDDRYYVGMTHLLPGRRAARHRSGLGGQFTKRIHVVRILWFETHPTSESARQREQQLKKWSHAKKQALIAGDIERLRQLSSRRS
jgi:putative endonuclease